MPATPPSGGDFHEAFLLNNAAGDRSDVVIGDVAGPGPEQALQAEHMRELLSGCLTVGLTPAQTLSAVNAMIEPAPILIAASAMSKRRAARNAWSQRRPGVFVFRVCISRSLAGQCGQAASAWERGRGEERREFGGENGLGGGRQGKHIARQGVFADNGNGGAGQL